MPDPVSGSWEEEPLDPEVGAIANGSFRGKPAAEIQTTGYVLHTLKAALWAFSTTDDYATGALAVVNLGGDADTSGAVFGQLAGAYYSADGISTSWLDRVTQGAEITMLAGQRSAAGTGQAGTGQAGTGQAGTGQAGTGQAGTGQAGALVW